MNERDGCDAMRNTIQEGLDGPVDVSDVRALEAHLAECESCREYRDGMFAVRQALRSIPLHHFPDDALEQVWERTVRTAPAKTGRQALARPVWRVAWRPLAAAAAVALALTGIWLVGGRRPEYSEAEIAQAAAELRLVLDRTARSMRHAETAAIGGVLANEVAPALERIPIHLGPSTRDRRSGT